jgi:hypothetical protein
MVMMMPYTNDKPKENTSRNPLGVCWSLHPEAGVS